MKLYIAVLDEFPDYMVPILVAHAVLGYHRQTYVASHEANSLSAYEALYEKWLEESFKKCVVRVNQKEFDKISQLPNVGLFHENNTLGAKKSAAVLCVDDHIPNVLKFAKLWKPKMEENNA